MNTKQLLIIITVAVLALGGGFAAGKLLTAKQLKIEKEKIYGSAWEDARVRFGKVCVMPSVDQANLKVKSFYGAVKEVKASQLVILANPLGLNDAQKITFTVNVTDTTRIKRVTEKSPQEYQKELAAFAAKAGNSAQGPEPIEPPPSKFTQEEAQLSSLKAGENVTVTAIADFDAKATEITAAEILADYKQTK